MPDLTIYEIAKKAGVSAATVSRVMNNYPHVQKATRAKVLKVLSECNYIPNNAARSLAMQESKMIGVLVADVRISHHSNAVYYVEHEFSKNGYSCLIHSTGSDPERQEKYIQLLSQKNVDAVVLIGSVYQNTTVQNAIMVNMPNTPVAICNGYLDGPNIYGVVADEKQGVSDCVKILADKGHRNIAFVANHFTPSNTLKLEGFKEGFASYLPDGEMHVVETGDTIEEICDGTMRVVLDNPGLDAIIFSEDYIATVGLHELAELQVDVPGRIAVFGINNSRYAMIAKPPLSSLDNMLYDTCMLAVRNLLVVLSGERANRKIMLGTKVVERKST